MTRAEKAQVLRWVVQDLADAFPGIDSEPNISGGEPRIVRTRIPVWVLVQARHLGTNEADLLRSGFAHRTGDVSILGEGLAIGGEGPNGLDDDVVVVEFQGCSDVQVAPVPSGGRLGVNGPHRDSLPSVVRFMVNF